MPVNLSTPVAADLHAISGVRIGVAEAGVRKAQRKDLTVFLLDEGTAVAGVFTQNRFCAAPVQICREHLATGSHIRAMLINTGNANAGTVRMVWRAPAKPAKRWPSSWGWQRIKSCRSPPA